MVSTRQYECCFPRTMDLMTTIFAVLHPMKISKIGFHYQVLGLSWVSYTVNMFTLTDTRTESRVHHILYTTVNAVVLHHTQCYLCRDGC